EVSLRRQCGGPACREPGLPRLRGDRHQAVLVRHHELVPGQAQQVQEVRVQARDLRAPRADREGEPLLQRAVPPLTHSMSRPFSITALPSTSTRTSDRMHSTRTPGWIFPPITRLSPKPRCADPTAFSASRCGPVTRGFGCSPKPTRPRERPALPPRFIASTAACAPTIRLAQPAAPGA